MTNDDVRALVVDLRGGAEPAECSWCGVALAPGEAVPEEAGDWVCAACFERESQE